MQKNNVNKDYDDSAFVWVNIYDAANAMEANIIKGLLMNAGIQCDLQGEILQGALGEIPFDQGAVAVRVYAIKERQAREILVNYQQVQQSTPDWVCPKCRELNGSTFEFCWSCRTVKNDESE
ncbi:putative signal transducing protein [Pseudoalteromonas mariniglutinosa]|uniref:putative signal transducing protein n=1 Tax=Pseudoalteromonas mariniglutinosa TaxID=206042 RepID=UPI00384DC3AC